MPDNNDTFKYNFNDAFNDDDIDIDPAALYHYDIYKHSFWPDDGTFYYACHVNLNQCADDDCDQQHVKLSRSWSPSNRDRTDDARHFDARDWANNDDDDASTFRLGFRANQVDPGHGH